jgi:hypothetical protein
MSDDNVIPIVSGSGQPPEPVPIQCIGALAYFQVQRSKLTHFRAVACRGGSIKQPTTFASALGIFCPMLVSQGFAKE